MSQLKPRLVKPMHKARRDYEKEVAYWQNLLNTDLKASTQQRTIYRMMRDWRQRQADERSLYFTDRRKFWEEHTREARRRRAEDGSSRNNRASRDETHS